MEVPGDKGFRTERGGMRLDDAIEHWIVYHLMWGVGKTMLVGPPARECGDVLDVCCRERGWDILYLLVRPDHVRISLRVSPRDSPADVARYLKAKSALMLRSSMRDIRKQSSIWTRSYYSSTASIGDIQARCYLRQAAEGAGPDPVPLLCKTAEGGG